MAEGTRRRRFIPPSTVRAAVAVAIIVVLSVAAAVLVTLARARAVPPVVGMSEAGARSSLSDAGFVLGDVSSRVSVTVPLGKVIEQQPHAGVLVRPGTVVSVVISAGPQTYTVPDLIGRPVTDATEALQALGFVVVTETAASETTQSVVLEMYPAPGASASVGDEVRLTVPGEAPSEETLLPYGLKGLSVLIDPVASPSGLVPDPAMEVGRRLQALLMAAGAEVRNSRTGTTGGLTKTERVKMAQESTAGLLISIDVGSDQVAGVRVGYLQSHASGDGEALARAITRSANLPGVVVSEPWIVQDSVLSTFGGTGVRITVGTTRAESDIARFADPAWADRIARAIYRGIGTTRTAP